MQPGTRPRRRRWATGSVAAAAALGVVAAMAPSGSATESATQRSADAGQPATSASASGSAPEDGGIVVTKPDGQAGHQAGDRSGAESGSAQADNETEETYIVQMAMDPVATYEGDVEGLPATRRDGGGTPDPDAPAVEDYAEHLRSEHRTALASVDGGDPLYHYVYSYDGFAAVLTGAQALELADQPDVVAVRPDEQYEIDTSSTPSFLGLDGEGELWDRLGGPLGGSRKDGAGEDVVIGVIDSGIHPESQSFADRDEAGDRMYWPKPRGFRGRCESAGTVGDDSWDAELCNHKLLAARHFTLGWGGDDGLAEQRPWEFASPRDYNGHGTHTASTAGGNHGVDVTGPAEAFGEVSGIAPRARIAAYKALYSTEDASTANGYASDLVAAVDQAVADGVDVVNYSVSGTSTDFLDPVEVAFMNAAEAGIFVAASAGNSGPTPATVAHPSPWVTTVAAGTHDRATTSTATLGNGDAYTGPSSAASGVGPVPFVDGAESGLDGADETAAARCYSTADNDGEAVLDPATVEGAIVLCERGGEAARVNKSQAVADAGGVGVVLVNSDDNSLNTDIHALPTVHVADDALDDIRAYATTEGATASIDAATIAGGNDAPYTAEFSSRGPLAAGGGDLLKPDLIAPGQDILAAVAPPGHNGLEFNLSSGTSMSAPHVAGVAALLMDLHQDWSPMMIKSALMTTGSDVLDGIATDPSVIHGQGAGHIEPDRATDPGLVYDSDADDWLAFLCGSTSGVVESVCDELEEEGHSFDTSDLNLASIGIATVDGTQTVTREVTNVGDAAATYTSSVTGLEGVDVAVEPSVLTLDSGETAEFTVTFTHDGVDPFTPIGGQLTWTDGSHDVRSPIVLSVREPGEEDWVAEYDGPGSAFGVSADAGYDVIPDPNGDRVYMSGVSQPPVPGALIPDFVTAAYDADTGDEIWTVRYDGSGGGSDEPAGFGITPDGDAVLVAGDSGGDIVTIAYDPATGEELWLSRFDGPGNASDTVNDLVVSPGGDTAYVTGRSNMGGNELDYTTLAYDTATGDELWASHYNGPGEGTDDARAVAVSPDGSTVVVTGQSRGIDTGLADWGTVAYDAATGEQLWDVLRDGPSSGTDISNMLDIGSDGTVVVAGSVRGDDSGTDWNTVGYDLATGEQLWEADYNGPGNSTDVPRASGLTSDGQVAVVTGNSEGAGTGGDYATIAYDVTTGEELWVSRHNGSADDLDIAQDLAITDDDTRVVITGYTTETLTGRDYSTIAYDLASGEQVWAARYDAIGAGDGANSVAVDSTAESGRRVFLTGQSAVATVSSWGYNNVDASTVAYLGPFD